MKDGDEEGANTYDILGSHKSKPTNSGFNDEDTWYNVERRFPSKGQKRITPRPLRAASIEPQSGTLPHTATANRISCGLAARDPNSTKASPLVRKYLHREFA
jgi:hypothetical protein